MVFRGFGWIFGPTEVRKLEPKDSTSFLNVKIGLDTAENEPRQVRCKIRAREPCLGIVSVLGTMYRHAAFSASDSSLWYYQT